MAWEVEETDDKAELLGGAGCRRKDSFLLPNSSPKLLCQQTPWMLFCVAMDKKTSIHRMDYSHISDSSCHFSFYLR